MFSNLKFNELMQTQFLGNPMSAYAWAVLVFIISLFILFALKNFVFYKLRLLARKTKTDLDDFLIELISKIKTPEYELIAFYIATRYLEKSNVFNKTLHIVLLVVFTYRVITIFQHLISYWLKKLTAKRQFDTSSTASVLNSTQVILKTIIWVVAALFVMHNLGINVSAILAGLGIGGVAVALASQAILGDLFNFFVILFDKPFKIGDFIIGENFLGAIEHIGLKSTRIRSLSGELLIISNSKLLSDKIHNYKEMNKRRVVFKIGVIYQTPVEKLKIIPAIIKSIITETENTGFDRANLSGLGDFSINFEIVYWILNSDYNLHMSIQEKILQEIIEEFKNQGIEFAYPTQTLFVTKNVETGL